MWHNAATPVPLDVEIKARVSLDTKGALMEILKTRPEGTNLSHLLREAVAEYLERRKPKAAAPIIALPAAEPAPDER